MNISTKTMGLTAFLVMMSGWALGAVIRVGAQTPVAAPPNALWNGILVAPEYRCSPYDSKAYPYPQSVEDRIIAELGGIYGPYTGRWFNSKRETDIEHIVARSEAHDSGLCAADVATRRRFSSDLLNLTLASPKVNRYQKIAKDAADWLPDLNQCWYASRVIEVRRKYSLTIDDRESRALDRLIGTCLSFDLEYAMAPPPNSVAAFDRAAAPAKCGPNRNCTELRRDHPGGVMQGHCAYRQSMDRDRDGHACQ